MPGRGHERQGSLEDVEVAPEVHGQHGHPVLFGAVGEVGLPGDAGHVDDGIEPSVLDGQLAEQGANRVAVGHRRRRSPGRATRGEDAAGRRLLLFWKPLGALEGHEGVDGDDEPAPTAELLGDRPSDPAPTARHDGDPLSPPHDADDRTSISSPSKVPASSHCSSRSR